MANKISIGAKRVSVAIALLIWVIASVFYGGIPIAIFFGVFMFIGSQELVNMAKTKGMNPPLWFIIAANFLFLGFTSFELYSYLFGLFAVIMVLALLLILFRGKDATLNDAAFTMFAIIYGGLFPIHAIMIRNITESSFMFAGHELPIGLGLILLTFLAVPACDIGAFYAGRYLGKHSLWKEVSPKKTIEGSIGGALGSMLLALLIGHFIGIGIVHSAIIGVIIATFAQLGDLAESMIKRDAGVKDSGTLFPGHGGVLDRSDSYILSVVAAYYYFQMFIV